MSAYGAISAPSSINTLAGSIAAAASPLSVGDGIAVYHVTLGSAPAGLVDWLEGEFKEEVERGSTYPQETVDDALFRGYFFANDVFVAIRHDEESSTSSTAAHGDQLLTLEEARKGREWGHCVVGFYYIKPNYPGRSSHICNAGFVVPHVHRGKGYGSLLAQSFLHFAPRLGYKASVFNLVYENNAASLRMWDRLGFTRVGRIPKAGRLKTKEGGEEYFDAWIIYKSFEE